MSVLVKNGRVIDPANNTDGVQDVLIAQGKIERVGRHLPEPAGRSEEHTSELQSPCNLVCRLLLEKKKTMAVALLG